MSWQNIIKEQSINELVKEALSLTSNRDFDKETYTKKDIKQIIHFFKQENKRDRLDQFDIDYNNEAIRLLEKALERLQ